MAFIKESATAASGQMIQVMYQAKERKLQIRYTHVTVGQKTDMMMRTVLFS